jgi:hypothetical protein
MKTIQTLRHFSIRIIISMLLLLTDNNTLHAMQQQQRSHKRITLNIFNTLSAMIQFPTSIPEIIPNKLKPFYASPNDRTLLPRPFFEDCERRFGKNYNCHVTALIFIQKFIERYGIKHFNTLTYQRIIESAFIMASIGLSIIPIDVPEESMSRAFLFLLLSDQAMPSQEMIELIIEVYQLNQKAPSYITTGLIDIEPTNYPLPDDSESISFKEAERRLLEALHVTSNHIQTDQIPLRHEEIDAEYPPQ